MAKTLADFAKDVRAHLAKGKLRPARKVLDKAMRAGVGGVAELEMEVRLAEGDAAGAAEVLARLASDPTVQLDASLKTGDLHLRRHPKDAVFRDTLWEIALTRDEFELATRHAAALADAAGFDAGARAKRLLARKDAVGAVGIFLLATLGGITTDRIKLADRLLGNEQGRRLLEGVAHALQRRGLEDGALHYVMAQLARRRGDRDAFLEYASRAFDEVPEELWTWTESNATAGELLEIAARKRSLPHLLKAAQSADTDAIIAVAQKSKSDGASGGALRAFALMSQGKIPNACRVLEKTIETHREAIGPVGALLEAKQAVWSGAPTALAAVYASGDAKQVARAADALLGTDERDEAWMRVAPRVLERDPARDDLRRALGSARLERGESVVELLESSSHLALARAWAGEATLDAAALRRAADLAEEEGVTREHADWILGAARGDAELLAELGRALSGGAQVSVETALSSAAALLDGGNAKEAAAMLAQLPLDAESGGAQQKFLADRRVADREEFASVAFRSALARGDADGARARFDAAPGNVQALTREAGRHADAARVLAEVLIEQGKGEVAVPLLEARRKAEDEPRALLPLVDTLLKASPKLGIARLLRGRLLHAMGRERDAVRDLCMVGDADGGAEAAFQLLGTMLGGAASGPAALGRADILLAKGDPLGAVEELDGSEAAPAERLARYDRILESHAALDAARRARAHVLETLGRVPEAAAAHVARFGPKAVDVDTDVLGLAGRALKTKELDTVTLLLERLADEVPDGAARALALIEGDDRSPMLVLRAKLSLRQGEPGRAVESLRSLIRTDEGARRDATRALEEIVGKGQARPESDLALVEAHRVLDDVPSALAALERLYADEITEPARVRSAAEEIVRAHDASEVRLFLARISLDQRDPHGATEHAMQARKLRPDARREVVGILQRALDLDAFAADTHFALAEAHLAGDEADDAVRHFRAAVEVDRPRAPHAIRALEEAAPRSQHKAMIYLAIGSTHADFLRAHDEAIAAFTQGLEAEPSSELRVSLLLGRGDAYAALRADDRAFDDFDAASHLDRLERRYYEFLRVNHRKREAHRAEEAAKRATEDFGSAVEACGKFIRVGRVHDAVTVAQHALAAAPADIRARYLVGVALHAAERYDAAVQVLEAVRAEAGADTQVGRAARMLLAESYLDRGDRKDARACLTEIESVDADYPGLRARRAALAPPADDPQAPPPLVVRPDFPRPTE